MSDAVYTGIWLDFSRSTFSAPTLTLKSNWAQVWVAVTTVLVQLTGAAVWILAAFALHHTRASNVLTDELDAQAAVVLRNSDAVTAILNFCDLGRAWKSAAPRARSRMSCIMIIPILIQVGFMIAGVLSSQIVYNPLHSHALLKPSECGWANNDVSTLSNDNAILSLHVTAKAYVKDCYPRQSLTTRCTALAKSRISYSESQEGICPAGPGTCATGDNGALSLSTSIDSHGDLGINARESDRVRIDYNMTCAPIRHELVDSFMTSNAVADYGNLTYVETTFSFDSLPGNLTTTKFSTGENDHYNFWTTGYTPDIGATNYLYAPFNSTKDKSTLALIMPNFVRYAGPSADPIFGTSWVMQGTDGAYYRQYGVNAVFCTEQFNICNPSTSRCTDCVNYPFTAPWDDRIVELVRSLDFNDAQNATYARLIASFQLSNFPIVLNTVPEIRAVESWYRGTYSSAQLPDDQWQVEVRYWYEFALASIQILTQNWAAPVSTLSGASVADDTDPNANATVPIQDPALARQCHTQRVILPTGYQNFSVVGLLCIICATVALVTAALFLRLCYHKLPYHGPGQRYYHKTLAWWANGNLQLHRKALEGMDIGGWEKHDSSFAARSVPLVELATKRVPPLYADISHASPVSLEHGTEGCSMWAGLAILSGMSSRHQNVKITQWKEVPQSETDLTK